MEQKFEPKYVKTHRAGMLSKKVEEAYKLMESCVLCCRYCRVNRMKGEMGFCKIGKTAVVHSALKHFNEEIPLVGDYCVGVVLFSGCNLGCCFCKVPDSSNLRMGNMYSPQQLADIFFEISRTGCYKLELITSSHQIPMFLEALEIAASQGFDLPIIWNCGGYESPEALAILDGVVDIYLPNFKFWDEEHSKKYLSAPDYPEKARAAIKEMQRQVGDLVIDEDGMARRGLILRQLVLPANLAGTDKLVKWVVEELSPGTYMHMEKLYCPNHKAGDFPEINRPATDEENDMAYRWAEEAGLRLEVEREIEPNWVWEDGIKKKEESQLIPNSFGGFSLAVHFKSGRTGNNQKEPIFFAPMKGEYIKNLKWSRNEKNI
jgi:putative pyruvate formate lyase activating enzyme